MSGDISPETRRHDGDRMAPGIEVKTPSGTHMHNGNAEPPPAAVVSRLVEADIQEANRLLGRRWTIEGEVVHGDKRGRLLGFPTANLVLPDTVCLGYGVYAVRVLVNGRIENGVACFGIRPQFDSGAPRLEIHILDFDEDIYGQHIVVEFVAFQRNETRFANVEALLEQMSQDCTLARLLLSGTSEMPMVESVLDRLQQTDVSAL